MQQAIPKVTSRHRQPATSPFVEWKYSLRLIGSVAGELMALASLVAALGAGLTGLWWLLGNVLP